MLNAAKLKERERERKKRLLGEKMRIDASDTQARMSRVSNG